MVPDYKHLLTFLLESGWSNFGSMELTLIIVCLVVVHVFSVTGLGRDFSIKSYIQNTFSWEPVFRIRIRLIRIRIQPKISIRIRIPDPGSGSQI
jgi:hypothetical protein